MSEDDFLLDDGQMFEESEPAPAVAMQLDTGDCSILDLFTPPLTFRDSEIGCLSPCCLAEISAKVSILSEIQSIQGRQRKSLSRVDSGRLYARVSFP